MAADVKDRDTLTPPTTATRDEMIHVIVVSWDMEGCPNNRDMSVWAYRQEEHADAKYDEIARNYKRMRKRDRLPGFEQRQFTCPLNSRWIPVDMDAIK
jgi:hypothetical protein